MTYELRQLQSCAANSIENLVKHNTRINLIIAMQRNGLTAYIALDHENENTALDSANIKAAAHTPVYMRPGICIERIKERTRGLPHSMPQPLALGFGKIGYPTAQVNGSNHIRPLRCDFALDRAVRAMKQGDYIQIFLVPTESVMASRAFDEATNQHFISEQCFHYVIAASSPAVATALIDDIAHSQAAFRITDTSCESNFTRRLNCSMMTLSESVLLAKAIDNLLCNMFKPDINSLMNPGTAQSFGQLAITVGFNNGVPVGFAYKHLLQNVAILGAVGSGKSELQASVIQQLHDAGIPCLVLAPVKHDFSMAFPTADLYRAGSTEHPLRFNLLDLPRDQSSARLAASALGSMISMGGEDSALPMIYESCLQGLYSSEENEVTLSALASAAKSELGNSGYSWENARSLTQAAINRLKSLSETPEFGCAVGNVDLDKVFHPGQITILELNDMEPEFRKAFSALFMERLRQKYLSLPSIGRNMPRLIVIIDELHELLREKGAFRDPFRAVLNNSLNVAGGQAVGFLFADQRLDLIGELAEYGCSSHVLMRGLATEQAASVLRLPMDSPLLGHLHRLKPGESLLHVTGEDTIAVGAAPLVDRNVDASSGMSRPVQHYCPYQSCGKVCTACDGQIHDIVKQAVLSQLYGPAYTSYRNVGSAYAQAVAAYNRAHTAHIQKPQAVPEPEKPASRREVVLRAKADLMKACLAAAVRKAREKDLDLAQIGSVLRHCTEQELVRQMAFRLDI